MVIFIDRSTHETRVIHPGPHFMNALTRTSFGIFLASIPALHADTFVQPVSQTTNLIAGYSVANSFNNTFNGTDISNASLVATGMTVPGSTANASYASSNTLQSRFLNNANTPNANGQGASFTAPGLSIVYNLGSAYDLSGMWFWNYRESGTGSLTNRGLDSVTIAFSNDNSNWSNAQVISLNLANANGYAEAVGFTGITGTPYQYVRFDTFSNFGTATGANTAGLDSYIGFNEVRFTAVPEASTYGLMGAGALAGIAIVRRRRRA